ncbi:variable surface protein [Plasmodium gonderi]|uniref:Variable surface protein n=1 Tax=Plasmodium gonderi TaxID=77519 RepID=A0A1Y1JP06_PLAGO|nr:variable surface protein [Plasmodium gonderi]GAW84221.1 variable surface protein [Plasmodium gonderi]
MKNTTTSKYVLKDIHDMYIFLINVSGKTETCNEICDCAKKSAQRYENNMESCKYNSYKYFCNELRNIKEQYDEKMISKICGPETPKTLPSLQSYNITIKKGIYWNYPKNALMILEAINISYYITLTNSFIKNII